MQVSGEKKDGIKLMVFTVDKRISKDILNEIEAMEGMGETKLVEI
jgi:hypothetical protein